MMWTVLHFATADFLFILRDLNCCITTYQTGVCDLQNCVDVDETTPYLKASGCQRQVKCVS